MERRKTSEETGHEEERTNVWFVRSYNRERSSSRVIHGRLGTRSKPRLALPFRNIDSKEMLERNQKTEMPYIGVPPFFRFRIRFIACLGFLVSMYLYISSPSDVSLDGALIRASRSSFFRFVLLLARRTFITAPHQYCVPYPPYTAR